MSDQQSGMERRLTIRLLSYWEKLRAGRDMPAPGDINAEDISDLWQDCFIAHIAPEGYRYSYIGSAISESARDALAANGPCELLPLEPGALGAAYAKLIETGKPVMEEGRFGSADGGIVRYRLCLLPLGEGSVSAIFGGVRFKMTDSL